MDVGPPTPKFCPIPYINRSERFDILSQATLMNDRSIEVQFFLRTVNYLLFDAALGHETVYIHLLGLANAMSPIHGLQVRA